MNFFILLTFFLFTKIYLSSQGHSCIAGHNVVYKQMLNEKLANKFSLFPNSSIYFTRAKKISKCHSGFANSGKLSIFEGRKILPKIYYNCTQSKAYLRVVVVCVRQENSCHKTIPSGNRNA